MRGLSATGSNDATLAAQCCKRRSKPRCSLGTVAAAATSLSPQVVARLSPRATSSSKISAARSRRRRGSTSTTRERSSNRSVKRRSLALSHGSHDSMPSNSSPSAILAKCSRANGASWERIRARSRTSSVSTSSRQPKSSTCSRSATERWLATSKAVSRSTSSPNRSMRIGWLAVEPKTSTIPPRTASSPRASTWYSRRYPACTRRATRSSGSSSAPRRTTTGSMSSTLEPSLCNSARIGATTTRGAGAGPGLGADPPAAPWRRRHIVRSLRPIVSVAGDTRSKGSVSHAGSSSTASGPRNGPRSCASCSASRAVAVATSTVGDELSSASAASTTERAESGTATMASSTPRSSARTGSPASRPGRAARGRGLISSWLTAGC